MIDFFSKNGVLEWILFRVWEDPHYSKRVLVTVTFQAKLLGKQQPTKQKFIPLAVCVWNIRLYFRKYIPDPFFTSAQVPRSYTPGTSETIWNAEISIPRSPAAFAKLQVAQTCNNHHDPQTTSFLHLTCPPHYLNHARVARLLHARHTCSACFVPSRWQHCARWVWLTGMISTVISENRFTRFLSIALARCASLPFWLAGGICVVERQKPCKSFFFVITVHTVHMQGFR